MAVFQAHVAAVVISPVISIVGQVILAPVVSTVILQVFDTVQAPACVVAPCTRGVSHPWRGVSHPWRGIPNPVD
jgi:hypothetical protein